ncbi:MAG: ribonuclease P protein component [Rickettsiales bacterium]
MGVTPTISAHRDVKRAMNAGKKISCRAFLFFYALPAKAEHIDKPARFAYTVTKKIGCAVVRNRIKRRLRVLAKECVAPSAFGMECVFLARHAILTMSFDEISRECRYLARRIAREGGGTNTLPSSSER